MVVVVGDEKHTCPPPSGIENRTNRNLIGGAFHHRGNNKNGGHITYNAHITSEKRADTITLEANSTTVDVRIILIRIISENAFEDVAVVA